MSGILNWAIEGYSLYKLEGLEAPSEMDILIKEYAEDMSSWTNGLRNVSLFLNLLPQSKIINAIPQRNYFNHTRNGVSLMVNIVGPRGSLHKN